MKIITLKKEEFEDFSNKHQFNTFYQSPNYADFEVKNNKYKTHYLGYLDDSNNLIGASLMLYKTLFWGYKYAYSPRGLLINYDDTKLITTITKELKKLLKKQKFIFITIDPTIIASERDKDGNKIQFNDNVNNILKAFNKNNYEHLGFNLYDESILPRWNVFAPLNKDARIMYNSFSTNIKDNITYANSISINIEEDTTLDVNKFYETIKRKYSKKGIKYFQNLIDAFKIDDKIKIFYAVLDTKNYTQNANKLYEKEEEKNDILGNIIKSGDNVKYNLEKVINDKLSSDKLLHSYKKDVLSSTQLLKSNPDGLILGCALVIKEAKGINVLVNYQDENYERYHANSIMTYKIMEYFGKQNYKYINLGSVTGNFDSTSKYYSSLINKVGFNSSILEYIGQFNIILNPTMYKIYQKKYQKK